MMWFLLIYLLGINFIAFLLYGVDKYRAKHSKWRIPESTLILSVVLGGSLGAILGMVVFHHKTRKPKFFIGVPLILLIQILITVVLVYKLIPIRQGETRQPVTEQETDEPFYRLETSLDEAEQNSQSLPEDIGEREDETIHGFEYESVPEFSGNPSWEVNHGEPFFDTDEITEIPFEIYSDLDELGRCGVAYANICRELMPTEPRGEIGSIKPSGWQTVKYNDLIDGNYLYNRCHLIAYSLAGENANEKNLITGTRYMNTEGMLPFEEKVVAFVEGTGYHVLYRVTPVFAGENLVASGVLMEALSVEDHGEGICFNQFVYNVQPGIVIDYATGESRLAEDSLEIEQEESEEKPVRTISEEYILNKNSRVFHYPDCEGALQMKEKNREYSADTRESLIERGYRPCGMCKP